MTTWTPFCLGCRALALALLEVETAFEDRWGFLSRLFSQMDQLQRMEDLKKVGESLLVVLSGGEFWFHQNLPPCQMWSQWHSHQSHGFGGRADRSWIQHLRTSWSWTMDVTWASLFSVYKLGILIPILKGCCEDWEDMIEHDLIVLFGSLNVYLVPLDLDHLPCLESSWELAGLLPQAWSTCISFIFSVGPAIVPCINVLEECFLFSLLYWHVIDI